MDYKCVFILITFVTCVAGRPVRRIINGKEVTGDKWPWIVSLYHNGQHRCAGVILDMETILTVGHCFDQGRGNKNEWKVYVGSKDLPDATSLSNGLPVKDIKINPYYTQPIKGSDIALVRLEPKVLEKSNVKPVTLPDGKATTIPNQACTVAGWGKTEDKPISTSLLSTDVRVAALYDCAEKYSYTNITSRVICAGGESRNNACHKDSGGPLICQSGSGEILHGLVSWNGHADGCGKVGYPTVYTNIPKYLNWILGEKAKFS